MLGSLVVFYHFFSRYSKSPCRQGAVPRWGYYRHGYHGCGVRGQRMGHGRRVQAVPSEAPSGSTRVTAALHGGSVCSGMFFRIFVRAIML